MEWFRVSQALLEKKPDEARVYLQKLRGAAGKNDGMNQRVAAALAELGQLDEARELLKSALALDSENPLVLARNVKEFTLEFWGPRSKDWEPEWLYTNQLPRLVRFTLGFGRPNQKVLNPEDVTTRVVTIL